MASRWCACPAGQGGRRSIWVTSAAWAPTVNGTVNSIALTSDCSRAYIGGSFSRVDGSAASNIAYIRTYDNTNQQLSPHGSQVLAEGTFTRVQGKARQQIFMLNLGRHGDVSEWYSAEFGRFCAASHPFYVKAAAWSPDASTVYVATTGFHPENWRQTFPLTGLCDAVAAFPATRRSGLTHRWVNYTGCDSLSSAAADSGAVYAGGHERWGD